MHFDGYVVVLSTDVTGKKVNWFCYNTAAFLVELPQYQLTTMHIRTVYGGRDSCSDNIQSDNYTQDNTAEKQNTALTVRATLMPATALLPHFRFWCITMKLI